MTNFVLFCFKKANKNSNIVYKAKVLKLHQNQCWASWISTLTSWDAFHNLKVHSNFKKPDNCSISDKDAAPLSPLPHCSLTRGSPWVPAGRSDWSAVEKCCTSLQSSPSTPAWSALLRRLHDTLQQVESSYRTANTNGTKTFSINNQMG